MTIPEGHTIFMNDGDGDGDGDGEDVKTLAPNDMTKIEITILVSGVP